MPTTTTGTEASWFLTVYETEILDANDSSTEPQNPGKPEWQTEQRQVFPSTEAQCLCEGKVFPFFACATLRYPTPGLLTQVSATCLVISPTLRS